MNDSVRKVTGWVLPLLVVIALIAVWQGSISAGAFRGAGFPTAAATFKAFGSSLASGAMGKAVGATLISWLISMVLVTVLAVIIGTALAFSDIAYRSAASAIEIFKAIPAIAILPLVILVLGSTLPMKIFLISFGAFWPLVIQVIYGVRSIDPIVLDTSRALGVRGLRRFLTVVIPSASPFIATGLRIASASALILAVVSELVGGADGIGRSILEAENGGVGSYPTMYAFIIAAGLLGVVLTGAFFLIERFAMHWHESQRNIRSSDEKAA